MGLMVKKVKIAAYCSLEWPSFGVGWPSDGTFSMPIILKVKEIFTKPRWVGHLDQYPYIMLREGIVEDPPETFFRVAEIFTFNPPGASDP